MKPLWIYGWLLCLAAMQAPVAAQSPANKWTFQRTGFRTTSGSFAQTALSMRTNESWPVVYSFLDNALNAYSLFPVLNAKGKNHISPETNWHQIGSNLASSPPPASTTYLQAASGSPDGFAISMQTTFNISSSDVVAIGNSISGFQPPQSGIQAVKFDDAGNPVTASNSSIPAIPISEKLYDIAVSKFGEVGAITNFQGTTRFWQRSPLLGDVWTSSPITVGEQQLFAPSADLVYDDASRPHIVGLNSSGRNVVEAFRFDIPTGAWTLSVLDRASTTVPTIADVVTAANDDGIVGAAWVNGGILKYAYLNTNQVSPQWVVTSVANTTPTGVPLELSQGVGLAFDRAGLPVISFVDRTMHQIWIAYDPPSAFGGGVTDQPGAEGDFNGDGFVDGYDVDAWGVGFGEGTLDGNDFLAWQRNANIAEPPAATAAVPEPLTLSSGLVAATLLFGSTRKSRRRAN